MFLSRCDYKKNPRLSTAAMFVDAPELIFGTCSTRHWGEYSEQVCKHSPNGLGVEAITSLPMEKFTKSELGTKLSHMSTNQSFFGACSTRHWGKHNSQSSFSSAQWFLRRFDNKKNPRWPPSRWPTAAMFVDGPEIFSVLAQIDSEKYILTKIKQINPVVLE